MRCSAKAYPLHALLADCAAFAERTGRRVSFEYTLLDGFNDSAAQVCAPKRYLRARGRRALVDWGCGLPNSHTQRCSTADVAARSGLHDQCPRQGSLPWIVKFVDII